MDGSVMDNKSMDVPTSSRLVVSGTRKRKLAAGSEDGEDGEEGRNQKKKVQLPPPILGAQIIFYFITHQ